MIRFFRKIRQELLTENKFNKYLFYAIGEIILVMIGILLALQVNNWNEERKLNQQELELLESLREEFTFNRDELERSIAKARAIQAGCQKLLANMGKHGVNLSQQESDSLLNAGFLNIISFDASNGILDNIISSGQIHIIKNKELKKYLANWGGVLHDIKEDETWAIDARNNMLLPFIYKNSNYINISGVYLSERNISSGFTTDYKAIYNSLEFENLVNSQLIWNMKNEWGYKRLKSMVEEIISLCEGEIGMKQN